MNVIFSANTSWFLYNFRRNTIKKFIDDGNKVYCLCPKDEFSKKLSDLGCDFIELPMSGKTTSVVSSLYSIIFSFFRIKKINPDIIFNSTIKNNIFIGLIAKLLHIDYCNNVSGLGTAFIHDGFKFKLARKMYGFVNRSAKHTFFENEDDYNFFINSKLALKEKSSILPGSGVDLDLFSYHNLPKLDNFRFVMISRLIKDKGIVEYINAIKVVKNKYPNVEFDLVGPLGVSNKTSIDKNTVDHWVESGLINYHGEQKDVRPFLINAHIFVLPSYREGLPRSVLEAQSIGRPAIVTDVPGCRQSIFNGKTGWLCEVKSSESLSNVMINILENEVINLEQMSLDSRQWVEENFSTDIVVKENLKQLNNMQGI